MHDGHGRSDHPRLALGRKTLGRIAAPGDREWFAADLEAGRAYTFNLTMDPAARRGSRRPCPLAVYGPTGVDLADSAHDGGDGRGAWRVTATASHSGPHRVAVGGDAGFGAGFELRVDLAAPGVSPPLPGVDTVLTPVLDLGDLTDFDGAGLFTQCQAVEADTAVCFRFGLTRTRRVAFGLEQPAMPARMRLLDGGGHTIRRADAPAAGGEWISAALFAGEWFLSARSDRGGGFVLRYRVSAFGPRPQEMPDRRPRTSLGPALQDGAAGSARHFRLVGGNEEKLFEVHERTGELFFVGTEDEAPRGTAEFELTVRAGDGIGFIDRAVAVTVTNVPDAGHGAPAPDRVSLGRVSGPHPQGLPLRYALTVGNDSGLYELDERTGELFLVGSPDDRAIEPGPHRLTVRVLLDRH